MSDIGIKGRRVTGGRAEGLALVSPHALSGWGGIDPRTGLIIETGCDLQGQSIAGRVLVFRGAKGSSGWSEAFHAARLAGAAPAAVIFTEMSSKLAAGLVAMRIPSMTDLEINPFEAIASGDKIIVDADRELVVVRRS